jgi:hypothetical protein
MPNGPENSPNIPRRRWPLRYVLVFVAGWCALPIIAWLVWGWIESTRLDRVLDALEARKERLDVADFETKPTTAAQKEASHLYAEAGKLVGEHGVAWADATRVSGLIEEACSTPVADGPGRASAVQGLQVFEEPYAKALDLVERASLLKGVGWDEDDRPERFSIVEIQPLTLARANVARIARLSCTGDDAGAAAALIASLRLQRFWNSRFQLIRTAHSLQLVLSGRGVSPEVLREIQEEYIPTTNDRVFEELMLRERAVWLSFMMPGVFSDPPRGAGPQRISPLEAIATRLARPLRDHRLVAEIDEFDQAIAIAKIQWPVTLDAVNAFAKAHPSIRSQSIPRGLLENLTRPWGAHIATNVMTSYVTAIAETLARARSSVGAVAVARFAGAHANALPETLDLLVPDYLSAPLIDPFSGEQLKYRHDATGYKVYSVGSNRKDDGGEWEQHSDLQLSRRGNAADIGIAVLLGRPQAHATATKKHK